MAEKQGRRIARPFRVVRDDETLVEPIVGDLVVVRYTRVRLLSAVTGDVHVAMNGSLKLHGSVDGDVFVFGRIEVRGAVAGGVHVFPPGECFTAPTATIGEGVTHHEAVELG